MAQTIFLGKKQFSIFTVLFLVLMMPVAFASEVEIQQSSDTAKSSYFTPMRSDAGLTKASFLIKKGKLAEAMQTIDNILKRNSRNTDALTYKGYVYFLLGDMKQATNFFNKVLKREPLHLGANLHLGQLYAEKGEVSRALEQLQVIRMYCGKTHCGEIDYLQAAINEARLK